MRYGRAERLIQLALEMQAARGGLAIPDIMDRFEVSRRTAIRMRDAVIRAFPQADEVQSEDRFKRWRIPIGSTQALAGVSADELSSLEAAAKAFEKGNLHFHAERLRSLNTKVRSILKDRDMRQIDPDLEALLQAEGIAHRPGPRPHIPPINFEILRQAIKSCRKVSFEYTNRTSRELAVRRVVRPLGFLYGHRHYLVASDEEQPAIKFFSLPSINALKLLDDSFNTDPEFDIKQLAERSFGVFVEEPFDVAWRFNSVAAPVARQFLFHESQQFEDQTDGSLIVRFRAGGKLEMAWHLITWGRNVEVLAPAELRELMPKELPDWPAMP